MTPVRATVGSRVARHAVLALIVAFAQSASADRASSSEPPAPPRDPGPIPALPAAKAANARLLDIAVAGSRLVAVGEAGVILESGDGAHWTQSASPTSVMLTRLRFTDEQHGWALGYDATVLETTDAGHTWALRHRDPAGRALFDVLFLDAQRGIAVGGYGTYLETADGGRSWTSRESVLTAAGMHLDALVRLGDGTLLAAGERGFLARSADAGASWEVLDSPYGGTLFGVLPRDAKGALVFGMRGRVYETADVTACPTIPADSWDPYARETVDDDTRVARLGWRRVPGPTTESLFGALPSDDGSALLLGLNGAALRVDAAGKGLTPVEHGNGESLVKAVRFQGRVYAVGRRGVFALDAVAAP